MNSIYAIYGASGFGREVMPLARAQLVQQGINIEKLFFIDDNIEQDVINGHKVLSYEKFKKIQAEQYFISIAIADGAIRAELYNRLCADNMQMWNITASNTVILDGINMQNSGVILCPFVTITSNIKIGKSFHANIYSYIAHDCQIGDFVTFAPGVKCNGNIIIEDYAYIGTGAIIKQGRPNKPIVIGRGAVIGMGAVVTKNIPEGVTVIGNPAKPLSRENLRR